MDITSMAAMLAEETSEQMQNIYIPLPLGLHTGFCIIATIVYILEIYRKKSLHYLFMMLAVDATMLMHAFPNSTMVAVLAVMEVLLLGTAGVMAFMEHKKKKLAEKQAEQAATEQTDTDVQAQQQGGEAQS